MGLRPAVAGPGRCGPVLSVGVYPRAAVARPVEQPRVAPVRASQGQVVQGRIAAEAQAVRAGRVGGTVTDLVTPGAEGVAVQTVAHVLTGRPLPPMVVALILAGLLSLQPRDLQTKIDAPREAAPRAGPVIAPEADTPVRGVARAAAVPARASAAPAEGRVLVGVLPRPAAGATITGRPRRATAAVATVTEVGGRVKAGGPLAAVPVLRLPRRAPRPPVAVPRGAPKGAQGRRAAL